MIFQTYDLWVVAKERRVMKSLKGRCVLKVVRLGGG